MENSRVKQGKIHARLLGCVRERKLKRESRSFLIAVQNNANYIRAKTDNTQRHSSVKIGLNTQKNSKDLRRLAVTQTPVREQQIKLVEKIQKITLQIKMREKRKELRRIRKLLETKLNSKNLIKVMHTLTVSFARYSGHFLNCTGEELRQMNQRTRKLITKQKVLHPIDGMIDYKRRQMRTQKHWGLCW